MKNKTNNTPSKFISFTTTEVCLPHKNEFELCISEKKAFRLETIRSFYIDKNTKETILEIMGLDDKITHYAIKEKYENVLNLLNTGCTETSKILYEE